MASPETNPSNTTIASGEAHISDFFNPHGQPQGDGTYVVSDWLKTDSETLLWLINRVHDIKEGNYDAIMPKDLSTVKRGAVLGCDILNDSKPQWISIPDEQATDADRRNYVIHICAAAFIESLIGSFAAPTTPDRLETVKPKTMETIKFVMSDLTDIARRNADPDIPFADKLDGNRNLIGSVLSPEKREEFRAVVLEGQRLNDAGVPVDQYGHSTPES